MFCCVALYRCVCYVVMLCVVVFGYMYVWFVGGWVCVCECTCVCSVVLLCYCVLLCDGRVRVCMVLCIVVY